MNSCPFPTTPSHQHWSRREPAKAIRRVGKGTTFHPQQTQCTARGRGISFERETTLQLHAQNGTGQLHSNEMRTGPIVRKAKGDEAVFRQHGRNFLKIVVLLLPRVQFRVGDF